MGKTQKLTPQIIIPDDEEEAAINRGIAEDPDAEELDDDFFRNARPVTDFPELVEILRRQGRLPLPPEQRKKRVTLYLDPDVLDRLKADGKGWQTRANAALRRALALD